MQHMFSFLLSILDFFLPYLFTLCFWSLVFKKQKLYLAFLGEGEEESEKAGLKLNIQKTKIMTSGPITSWQIDGEKVETVSDFILLGSKITADSDGSHEMKRCLLLGRKAMTYLDSILKSKDISQSYVFSSSHVWMWELNHKEAWVSTKELMLSNCGAGEDSWRVPWISRRSNQSILNQPKSIFIEMTDAEAEAPILWPPDVKSQLTGKDPNARKDWGQEVGDRRWDGWMALLTRWTWVWAYSGR